jgi:hypothetical protein
MVKEDKVVVLECIGGVDENSHKLNRNPTTNLSNVESVHLRYDNDLVENDELHLTIIAIQTHKWKPNNRNSICWGFFAINDNFFIDIKNPKMLQRIICRSTP